MDITSAIDALGALSQETRLKIFRLLVRNAPEGLAAGELARRLHLPGPTLSFHLNVLSAADLVQSHKNGRSISYSANVDCANDLAGFLLEDCCGGKRDCLPKRK
jgi:ArsR family transcriptional regulator